MSVVYHTSAENFSRDVLNSPVPVLVDFYARLVRSVSHAGSDAG